MAEVRPIDANALLDESYGIWAHGSPESKTRMSTLKALIDDAPTIDYAPVRHGEWVWDDDGFCRCSHCEQKAPVVPQCNDEPITTQTDYCPNCGAKMDGGKRND